MKQKFILQRNNINAEILLLEKKLGSLPKGKLLCSKNGNSVKWFVANGSTPIYISKKHSELAQKLAARRYYEQRLQMLKGISCRLERLLTYLSKEDKKTLTMQTTTGFSELLSSYFQSFPDKQRHWLSESYIRNENFPEHLIHQTLAGHLVRSKSEVIIANALFQNQIPYRYESQLTLDDINLFPDFTILHPITQNIIYWEHFGMMDKPSYAENTFNKLKLLSNHNIIPSINLITTFETKSHPLSSLQTEHIIQEFFYR